MKMVWKRYACLTLPSSEQPLKEWIFLVDSVNFETAIRMQISYSPRHQHFDIMVDGNQERVQLPPELPYLEVTRLELKGDVNVNFVGQSDPGKTIIYSVK